MPQLLLGIGKLHRHAAHRRIVQKLVVAQGQCAGILKYRAAEACTAATRQVRIVVAGKAGATAKPAIPGLGAKKTCAATTTEAAVPGADGYSAISTKATAQKIEQRTVG